MVVLQQGEHSSVNNSRPAGKEVTDTRKKRSDRDIGEHEEKEKGSEGAVQKRTFNYFPRPRLKTFLCDTSLCVLFVLQIG